MKTATRHIHIGIEPDYRLYGRLHDMRDEVQKMNIPQEEKDAREYELCALSVLANRPRFDEKYGRCRHTCAELDALAHRYYPEYTFER